ncbi:unnamed protein product [Triticum turgidum subsp. durum]|uniref:Uncharacterized protein n=1 Tax=Triticum turgidum subsp. durum TaxID=4567 RepID=A0A9R0YTY2_TRITD|nr:unnamed protein product [Triticum turgidum subsp. durum]
MACVNMYNPDGGAVAFGGGQPGPRISFSSDFSMEPPPPVQNRAMGLRCQEEDQNFEFSVGSHPMMAADQLFSKGRILPFKVEGGCPASTLRDELRAGPADDDRASTPKGSSRWREMLGLRKSLCVGGGVASNAAAAKKSDKVVAVDADAKIATDMAAPKQVRPLVISM